MHTDRNAVTLEIRRKRAQSGSNDLIDSTPISMILRPDIEDRSNHAQTKAYAGPEAAWIHSITNEKHGFLFSPASDRRLRISCAPGTFTGEPEWSYMVAHPYDSNRGFEGSSDLFSPGYFATDIAGNQTLTLQAEIITESTGATTTPSPATAQRKSERNREEFSLDEAMRNAMRSFIVKRDDLETVIAGYPWFLDWGRDTLICLRGLIAAGLIDESTRIIRQFARFEQGGTLPNMLRGSDASNRDTSDAPLWLFVACGDLMRATNSRTLLDSDVGGRTIRDVLRSIVASYIKGTPNGVAMDHKSGLVFSPSHFTWMDTNFPAGSPRQGYPIEIQALWYSALETLAGADSDAKMSDLAGRVRSSIVTLYRKDGQNHLCDCLHGTPGQSAKDASPDDALRPNQLLAVTLSAVSELALRQAVVSSCEELLVPGAIRTLADRPVKYALPVMGSSLLNDPHNPYWGRYEGDEDTRRKPAYHNGTAWAWLAPSFSEALHIAYGATARETALSILSAGAQTASRGCLGYIPEIVDGDAPHILRGCGAQAWSVTELYRVLAVLSAR
ncbi:MAG: amylo-alpha-1,6-glucosidase, partial [bacterium]